MDQTPAVRAVQALLDLPPGKAIKLIDRRIAVAQDCGDWPCATYWSRIRARCLREAGADPMIAGALP